MVHTSFVSSEKDKSELYKKTRLQNSLVNNKLDSNPISKTKNIVGVLDSYLNDKMMKDELKSKFAFNKKSSNHIIRNYGDNVSYRETFP